MTPETAAGIFLFVSLTLPLLLLFLWVRARRKVRRLSGEIREQSEKLEKYVPIIDIDNAIEKSTEEKNKIEKEVEDLRSAYKFKMEIFEKLKKEAAIFDEKLSFAELGVYEPHFEFDDSDEYKEEISAVREEQKEMVSEKLAVECHTQWTVDGSASKGKTMMNRAIRLTLRAFNNECEAAIANTRWNNIQAMEKRILRAQEQLDKLNQSNNVVINPEYVHLKLKELFLTHEYRERLKIEKDERAEAARLAREEQKLIKDAERAQKKEQEYEDLLAKVRAEVAGTTGEAKEALERRVKELETELTRAHEEAERAQAMAQMTRSGYVYIISNIGSFGADIVKIGMTRRLEPQDRVRELGDASVPFLFDTHAMIYSDNAPDLEARLHAAFDEVRVNAANPRKEFFRATLEDVRKAVAEIAPDAQFFSDVEAQEFKETLARRQALKVEQERDSLPAEI
jgi:hypothetical protein